MSMVSYARLQQGGDQQQPVASGFYDPKFAGGDFPQPFGSSAALSSKSPVQTSLAPPASATWQGGVGAAPAPSRRRGSNNFGRYLADKGFRILLWVWAALTLAVGVYALWLLAGVIPDEDFRIVSEIGWHIQCGSLLVLLVAVTLLAVFGVLVACAAFVVGYSEVRRSLRTLETSAGLLGFGIIALVIISVVCSDRCRPHATRVANLVCQETLRV